MPMKTPYTNSQELTINREEQIERQEKITAGLKIVYARMLEFKRQKDSEVAVIKQGKITRLKP